MWLHRRRSCRQVGAATPARLSVRLRTGFAYQLPQLSGQMSTDKQVLCVSLRPHAPTDFIERYTLPCTCQLKGSLYCVHVRLHEMTTRSCAKGSGLLSMRCAGARPGASGSVSIPGSPPKTHRPAELPVPQGRSGKRVQLVVGASQLDWSGCRLPGLNSGRLHFTGSGGMAQPLDGWRQIPRAALAFANDWLRALPHGATGRRWLPGKRPPAKGPCAEDPQRILVPCYSGYSAGFFIQGMVSRQRDRNRGHSARP